MKLQATIGRRDNRTICELVHLGGILSNFGCVPDRRHVSIPISVFDYLANYDLSKGEAIIRAKNLKDPQALYRYLSEKGYTLIRSKLIQD